MSNLDKFAHVATVHLAIDSGGYLGRHQFGSSIVPWVDCSKISRNDVQLNMSATEVKFKAL